jgi:glutamyl-tRNA(Gln) amidotransferase subunit D
MSGAIIDLAVASGQKGIILEGSGLGHVSEAMFPALERAVKNEIVVVMTSQCIWGRVHMNVYSTGRDLLSMGVIPLADMLPETALVKLMWALANEKSPAEVKAVMTKDLAGELSDRRILETVYHE